MSKWIVRGWSEDSLEIEADRLSVEDGALLFSRNGVPVVGLAEGTWTDFFEVEAIRGALVKVAPSSVQAIEPRGLAAVVNFPTRSREPE